MWYLVAPDTGVNDVVASQSTSGDTHLRCVTYTGCDQTDPLGDTGTDSDSADTTADVSLTIEESTSWVIMFNRGSNGAQGSYTGLVSTARSTPAGTSINIGDSNGTVSSGAGTATYTDSETQDWGAVAIEIRELVAATTAESIKTINGLTFTPAS